MARDLEDYIEQALEGASRIRAWLIDDKPAADEARKLLSKAAKGFDAISCLARGGADRTGDEPEADRNRAQEWARPMLGIPQPDQSADSKGA